MKTLREKIQAVMKRKQQNYKQASAEIGCSPPHLCRVLNGKVECGIKLANKIEAWSEGRIKAKAIMFP